MEEFTKEQQEYVDIFNGRCDGLEKVTKDLLGDKVILKHDIAKDEYGRPRFKMALVASREVFRGMEIAYSMCQSHNYFKETLDTHYMRLKEGFMTNLAHWAIDHIDVC